MVFITDVAQIYKNVIERDIFDVSGKTAAQIVDDFKLHIMYDVNSPLVYHVYTRTKFIFKNHISNELVTELRQLIDVEISPLVEISNELLSLNFTSLV